LDQPSIRAVGEAAHGYWLANRFRFDAWHQKISQHRQAIDRCGTSQRWRLWNDILPTLEEILLGEPLTRVVAYLSEILHQHEADADWAALAHSVLTSHIEARHRCLNLMVFGYGLPVERAVALNRVRREAEYFTDQLISSLPAGVALDEYVHDLELVKQQQRQFNKYPFRSSVQRLRQQSMYALLEQSTGEMRRPAAHPRLNQNIAESALGMFPPQAFDSLGVLRTPVGFVNAKAHSDSDIHTDDFDHPLQSPFDLLQPPTRIPNSQPRRRS
jgi:hypothetical protein